MKDIRTDRAELVGEKRVAATQTWVRKMRIKTTFALKSREKGEAKVQRRKAHSWLICFEAMLRNSTRFTGFEDFHYPPSTWRTNPFEWKLLQGISDMGSDGVAGANFLKNHLHINYEPRYGPSHRAWNDTKAAIRFAQLWCHELLMIICYNAEYGSWHDDERCWQVRDVVQSNFDTTDEATDGIFDYLLDGLLEDSGLQGEVGDPEIRPELYAYLTSAPIWRKKFAHVSTNRFFGAIRRGQEELPWWTCRLYGYVSLMIETNTLPSSAKTLDVKLVRPDPAQRSTAKQKEQAMVLKQSAKNVTELAYLMYSDLENKYIQVIVTCFSDIAVEWYEEHNTSARSGLGTFKWIMNQCVGRFFKHLVRWPSLLEGDKVQLLCGMHISEILPLASSNEFAIGDAAVASQDKLASYMGNLTLGFLAARLKHGLHYLVGWPTRSVLFASNSEVVQNAALAELRKSYDTFLQMLVNKEKHPLIADFVRKSEWDTVPCIHLVGMLRFEGWQVSERFKKHCRDRNCTFWADQVPEDGFNYAKAAARAVPNKRLSHMNVWMAPVKKHVLDHVHQWAQPPLDELGEFRKHELADSTFVPTAAVTWARLADIKTTSEPSWHSPAADRLQETWADQVLFRHAMEYDRTELFGNVWQQVLFTGGEMLVRDRTARVCSGQWMYPLVSVGASCFLAWRATEVVHEGVTHKMFKPSVSENCCSGDIDGLVIFVLDMDDWEAMEYTWASPLHQHLLTKGACDRGTRRFPSALSVQAHDVEPLRSIAARSAYWHISVSPTLVKLAAVVGCDIEDCADDFSKVFKLVKHELDCDDEVALAACRRRQFFVGRERSVDDLMKSEDVLELLSKDDQKDFLKKKKDASLSSTHIKAFNASLKEKSKELKALAQPRATRGARAKAKLAARPWGGKQYRQIPEGSLTQAEIRDMMPPGCSVWRHRHQSRWCTHFPEGRAYFARSWSYGHREAALFVVAATWGAFLDWNDMEASECPIPGLLESAAA